MNGITMSDVPAPDSVPPVNNPDPQPGDGKQKAPPSEGGRTPPPVELPGRPNVPERVDAQVGRAGA